MGKKERGLKCNVRLSSVSKLGQRIDVNDDTVERNDEGCEWLIECRLGYCWNGEF